MSIINIVLCLIAAALGAGGAWEFQANKIKTLELDYANTRISEQRAARAVLERTTGQIIQAQNAAASRAVELRRTADASRTELDRLRLAADAAMRAAATSADAAANAAATSTKLLLECGGELTTLAASSDRHVSDIQTLVDAWPK